jgi:PadR family transcriptional regulator PadR
MSTDKPRLTTQGLKVLGALMSCPRDEVSGADIARATKLPSGTLYPILVRLENARWLESSWEVGDPHELGRPRRRFYRITSLGMRSAQSAFREVTSTIRGLAWG